MPVTIKNLAAEDVKIRILGDFAIIHAATSYTTAGRPAGARPLHRLLGEAERQVAGGVGACVAVEHHRVVPANAGTHNHRCSLSQAMHVLPEDVDARVTAPAHAH